jgi:hypothetical protein
VEATTMNGELGSHHRDTLERLFNHPTSGNIEWRQVRSLLEAVGDVADEPNGNLRHPRS